jgi:predicted nucleotidyltransferase
MAPRRSDPVTAYRELLDRAARDPQVVGVVAFGSRAAGPFARPDSDVDTFVVIDGSAAAARSWETKHGAAVEVWALTLEDFRRHALPGEPTAWNRPAMIRARVDFDRRGGEIGHIVDRKRRLAPDEARDLVATSLDQTINSMYRALGNLEGGRSLAGRLDALESVGPLLATVFAMEERVRPFNKWLAWELAEEPLRTPEFGDLINRVETFVADPTTERIRDGFRAIERPARAAGHGPVVDGWEPHVAWLRGKA